MCGIVLAGGNLSSGDLELFNQLLYCDVFRGVHSTGVMMKRLNESEVRVVKDALPSYALLLQDEYKAATRGTTTYAVPPAWLVGHNRHATRGAVNARNAHPFKHEHITLVHNGTLTNQSLLPDHRKYEVDSENICYSIATWGADKTIQNLDGAYTLIWHDNSDNTLHIIRNEERPFHLARVGQDWFGASEEDMLMWLLKRSKSHKNRVGEHFECKVGVEYIFDVGTGSVRKMQLVEEKEHKMPVFTYASRYGTYYGTSWLDEYEEEYRARAREAGRNATAVSTTSGQSHLNETHEQKRKVEIARQNQLAKEAGLDIRRDQLVSFTPSMFEPYSGPYSAGKGKMTGYIFDDKANVYFELDAHNVLEKDYKAAIECLSAEYQGTISCIHKVDNMIRCVVVTGKFTGLPADANKEPDVVGQDDDAPFDTEASSDSFVASNDVTVTKKFWHQHAHGECGGCGSLIAWSAAPKAVFAYQCYWHPECLARLGDDPSPSKSNSNEPEPELAICAVCAKLKYDHELDTEMSTHRMEDICKDCGKELREKIGAIALDEPKWIKVIDRTNARQPEISLRITKEMFQKMILMGAVSVRTDIEFKDLDKCYVEKRAGNNFAYAMLPDGVKSPYTKEETKAETASTFPRKGSTLSLRKVVTSDDGKRTLDVTKALWGTIGFCEFCYKQIPWKDVEGCTLSKYNRIVCTKDVCKGKHERSK